MIRTYLTNWDLKHNGRRYPPGSRIELEEEVAAPLVGGVLSEAEPEGLTVLTVAQLRALADERGIDLGKTTRKADIISLIEGSEAQDPVGATDVEDAEDPDAPPIEE